MAAGPFRNDIDACARAIDNIDEAALLGSPAIYSKAMKFAGRVAETMQGEQDRMQVDIFADPLGSAMGG